MAAQPGGSAFPDATAVPLADGGADDCAQEVCQAGGTAGIYGINQEKYLKVFLDDGEVPMDNNAAEQSIRGLLQFCIGTNYLPFTFHMPEFKLQAPYKPTGGQPQAIAELVKGFKEGNQFQTLLGVTGSGKTFTMANVIQELQKPTLVIAHNKTLAAQLYGEFKEFFPENAVEYFVSY